MLLPCVAGRRRFIYSGFVHRAKIASGGACRWLLSARLLGGSCLWMPAGRESPQVRLDPTRGHRCGAADHSCSPKPYGSRLDSKDLISGC
jgi:hypothetical protein